MTLQKQNTNKKKTNKKKQTRLLLVFQIWFVTSVRFFKIKILNYLKPITCIKENEIVYSFSLFRNTHILNN